MAFQVGDLVLFTPGPHASQQLREDLASLDGYKGEVRLVAANGLCRVALPLGQTVASSRPLDDQSGRHCLDLYESHLTRLEPALVE
jgi:hypothetical protein